MTHLARAGVLLVAVLFLVFVGLRMLPTSGAMSNFGFQPQDDAVNADAWASLPVQYASPNICVECHSTNYNLWANGNHKTVNCENCHMMLTFLFKMLI